MHFFLWFLLTLALLGVAFAVGFVAEWLSDRTQPAPMMPFLPAPRSPVCPQCREVYPGTRVHHVTTSAWHRSWEERDWQIRAGLR